MSGMLCGLQGRAKEPMLSEEIDNEEDNLCSRNSHLNHFSTY